MPWVSEYRYLGVRLNRTLSLAPHVRYLRNRANALFWQVCGWARRESLPLPCLLQLVSAYVVPACTYGSELLCGLPARMAALSSVQRELGRYLLQSPHAPNCVVQGDVGWQSWDILTLERAAGLLSRLQCAPTDRLAVRVYRYALRVPGSWCHTVQMQLVAAGIPLPSDWGLNPGAPPGLRSSYVRDCVRPALHRADVRRWRDALSMYADTALQLYRRCVPHPIVSDVHTWRVPIRSAMAWGRLRSGSSCLGADRPARHARASSSCVLCGAVRGDAAHCVVTCPVLSVPRDTWWRTVWPAFAGRAFPALSSEELLLFFFAQSPTHSNYGSACAAFAFAIERAHSGSPGL